MRVTFSDLSITDQIYMYKDFGEGAFVRDFVMEWDMEITGLTTSGPDDPYYLRRFVGAGIDRAFPRYAYGGCNLGAKAVCSFKNFSIPDEIAITLFVETFEAGGWYDKKDPYPGVLNSLPLTYFRLTGTYGTYNDIEFMDYWMRAYSDPDRTILLGAKGSRAAAESPIEDVRYVYPFMSGGMIYSTDITCVCDGYIENFKIDGRLQNLYNYITDGDTEGKLTITGDPADPITGDPVIDALLGVQQSETGQLEWESDSCAPACGRDEYVQHVRDLINGFSDDVYTAKEKRTLIHSAQVARGENGKVVNQPQG